MKKIIFIMVLLISIPVLSANYGRVCIRKDTGALIEFQSGDAPLGVLINNAVTAGIDKKDIVEMYVTKEQWAAINKEQISDPTAALQADKEANRLADEAAVKQLLGLTDEEFGKLKNAIH